MADQTTSSVTIDAAPADVMAVIADFERYPEWAKGMREVRVASTFPDGRAEQVDFSLDAAPIKDDYTLSYRWDDDRSVRWSLVRAKVLKAMEGSYELAERDGATDVTYSLTVDLTIPVIGMLRRKGEKVIIDTALKGLKKRVEQGA